MDTIEDNMNWLLSFFGWNRLGGARRSSRWNEVRKHHLLLNPRCAVCGSKRVSVHHIRPFWNNPSLELEPSNLITLCDGFGTWRHHLEFGHLGSFKSWNENVKEDAKLWQEKILKRP